MAGSFLAVWPRWVPGAQRQVGVERCKVLPRVKPHEPQVVRACCISSSHSPLQGVVGPNVKGEKKEMESHRYFLFSMLHVKPNLRCKNDHEF